MPFKSTTDTAKISKPFENKRQYVYHLLDTYDAHPYHSIWGHPLMLGGQARRFDFCNFMLNALGKKSSLLCDIQWTDESTYTRAGIMNVHNVHYWSLENPHIPT